MSFNLSRLDNVHRLLFEIPLAPLQGRRFQPTGFPGLGAATFQTESGTSMLVESAQSMANRLELTCWNEAAQDLKADLKGLSHVRVFRNGLFLTDTILESHRLNSPYLLEATDKIFFNKLQQELGVMNVGAIDRRKLAEVLLKYDIGSLLHGVFLAKKDLGGGRYRMTRALSAFIEADGVRIAASGGVKNDHIHPGKVKGDSKNMFGNLPFARDEFTADRITLFVNFDLSQIRGYGLGSPVEHLLMLVVLYKLRALVDSSLRLRTACDLRVIDKSIKATMPEGFDLPELTELSSDLKQSIKECADKMIVSEVSFNDELNDELSSGDNDADNENTEV